MLIDQLWRGRLIFGVPSSVSDHLLHASGQDVLDDVEVRRVGWPLKNSKLLLGKPLLYDVSSMNLRSCLSEGSIPQDTCRAK